VAQPMATDPKRRAALEPLYDIDPRTGASIEVFYADRALETFGRGAAGWFWWPRRRGSSPDGPAIGPFPTRYSAYRNALHDCKLHGRLQQSCNADTRSRFGLRSGENWIAISGGSMVPRGGIEPPTLRFSVACSTN
jgi:hypothetical protein